MQFNLSNDLVFFDIESTGLNVVRDRILQIALIKYKKDSAEPEELSLMINPGIPISPEAMDVHGITPEMLKNKPSFSQVAQQIYDFIGGSDLAGYNSDRFDVPMLLEEFARVGLPFSMDNRKTLDIQKIFYKMEPRTLTAAYRYYCKKEMENAHDALADVRATVDVFKGQLNHYDGVHYIDGDGYKHDPPIVNDIAAISNFIGDNRTIDATQRLKYDKNGVIVFNFGKYNGAPVAETIHKDKQYYHWILDKEFSVQVKEAIRKLYKEYEQKQSGS